MDEGTLRDLGRAFALGGSHPLEAIVPQDIRARIDLDFDKIGPKYLPVLAQAMALIAEACPWIHNLVTELISHAVPIVHRPAGKPVKRGFSTPLCYGAVFLTFEDRFAPSEIGAVELAIDLAHEVGHHVLHTYQTADSILESDLRAPVYSGVKETERPAIMSIHASVALSFMIAMASELAKHPSVGTESRAFAAERRDAMRIQQRLALEAIRNRARLTGLGERIVEEMGRQLAAAQTFADAA